MSRACAIGWIAMVAAGCVSEPEATCRAFVSAWANYEVRCGAFLVPPRDEPADEEERAEVEMTYFGEEGCASATLEDFRDARALREVCPAELSSWGCDEPGLPASCADQIRR